MELLDAKSFRQTKPYCTQPEEIGDGVIATDAQRRVTRLNPVAEQLTGWSENDAVGRPIDEVFVIVHELSKKPAAMPVDEVLTSGTAKSLADHTLLIARDGVERPIADKASPIRDDAGHMAGVVLVFRDASREREFERKLQQLNADLERRVAARAKELEQSERFNRAILDSLSAHIAVVDRTGNIVATNTAWREFARKNHGADQSMNEGVNYLSVCDVAAESGDTEARTVAQKLRDILACECSHWEFEYPCHSPDRRLWFVCQIKLCYINEQPHAVIAHENITNIKVVQEELELAKESAVQSSLAKSEFLASMSHELRTPLNGILGMNTLLMRTALDDRQRRLVEACASSGKLLADLINDILDLSKIEAGKLDLDPHECELETTIYGVIELFANSVQESEVRLTCQLSPAACVSARLDDNRLRQVLVNLIGNAIKFTASGSVSVTGDRIENSAGQSRLRIEVTDSGIGIPPERIDRLFKPFSQVDSSTTRHFGGTGLGLSICQQLIALMNGEIGVESQVGVGSTFWFEIPLEIISQPAKQARRRRTLAGTQVVVVDGIGSFAQVAECVTSWGCHFTHVETFDESLELLEGLTEERAANVVVFCSVQAIEKEPKASQAVIDRCSRRVVAFTDTEEFVSEQGMRSTGIAATLQDPVRPSDLFEVLSSTPFQCEIDSAAEPEPSNLANASQMPTKLTGHLLVAEDNQINQLYVVEMLKLLGCTCDIAVNGEEVLSLVQQGSYDLLLMDCQMPEMDGFTATREIRRLEANSSPPKHVPIVAVTANALKGDRERCLDAGMDDYVKKPIEGEELRSTLSKFLLPSPTTSQESDEAK